MPWFTNILPSDLAELHLWDSALRFLHAALVIFLVSGWAIRPIRRLHLYVVGIVWASWLGLGLYVGHLGYCVITDLQWQVKQKLGETPLPRSYIEYEYQRLGGGGIDNTLMAWVVAGIFLAITLLSLWVNFRPKKPLSAS